MKVILKKDIPNVGQAGQVKDVSEGYARNFLLPRQLASVATPDGIARAERQTAKRAIKVHKQDDRAGELIKKLADTDLVFQEKANDEGHLFASVKVGAIVKSIKQHTGITVDEAAVQLDQPIKQIGQHAVIINIAGQTVQCLIDVQAKP